MRSFLSAIRYLPYAVATATLAATATLSCADSTGVDGHRVQGTIVFDAGGPPAGSPSLTGRLPMEGATVHLDRGGVSLSATSDADGRFAFEGLATGRWRLAVSPPPGYRVAPGQPSPWFVDLTGGGDAVPLEVLLATAADVGTIAAQVTVDGMPIVNHRVSVYRPEGSEPLASGLTQDSGVATIPIAPGTYDVEIAIPDGLPTAGDPLRAHGITVEAGRTTWVPGFTIGTQEPPNPNTAVVFGNALLDEGVAYVPNVVVELAGGGTVLERTTDAFGSFRFGGVEPGEWQLTVTPPPGFIAADGASLSAALSLVAGDSVYFQIDLAAEDGTGSLLAQAIAAAADTALPIAGVTIRVFDPGTGDEIASGVTGSNPTHFQSVRFSLAPGLYDVEVVPPAGYRVPAGVPARHEDVAIRTGRLTFLGFELEPV